MEKLRALEEDLEARALEEAEYLLKKPMGVEDEVEALAEKLFIQWNTDPNCELGAEAAFVAATKFINHRNKRRAEGGSDE